LPRERARRIKDAKPADKPAEAAPARLPKKNLPSPITHQNRRPDYPYKATAATILLKKRKRRTHRPVYFTAYTRSDARTQPAPYLVVYNAAQARPQCGLHMGSFPRPRDHRERRCHPARSLQAHREPILASSTKSDLVFVDLWETDSATPSVSSGQGFLGVDQTSNPWRNSSTHYQAATAAGILRNFLWVKVTALSVRGPLQYCAMHDGLYFHRHRADLSVLNLGTIFFNAGETCLTSSMPSYTATAWYHKV